MTTRNVNCLKLNQELPGLEKPPFPGKLGEQIFESISAEAWKMWQHDMQIKVINEYRLDMTVNEDYDTLIEQMQLFLNLKTGSAAEVENPNRGK